MTCRKKLNETRIKDRTKEPKIIIKKIHRRTNLFGNHLLL